jgi:poly(hydroxyalkanoate) depolymerase family esterase
MCYAALQQSESEPDFGIAGLKMTMNQAMSKWLRQVARIFGAARGRARPLPILSAPRAIHPTPSVEPIEDLDPLGPAEAGPSAGEPTETLLLAEKPAAPKPAAAGNKPVALPDFLNGWRMPTVLEQLELPLPPPPRDLPPASEAGRTIEGSYANHAGKRDYRLYIPRGYRPGEPMPLLVMLHGCGQNPDDFAAGTRMNELADERGFLVAYPAQSPSANGSRCWNWFYADDQQRDQGEPSIIAGITREIIDGYSVDARRVYVAGLSAGGAMAVILGSAYPELYAAVGVHSGMPYAAARDLPSALAVMRGHNGLTVRPRRRRAAAQEAMPVIVFHGDRDTTVHPDNGAMIVRQALPRAARPAARTRIEQGQVPDGHAYTRTIHRNEAGTPVVEQWMVHGAGHAWSGGSDDGSYTDRRGPDASQEMMRFFATHPKAAESH